MFRSFLYSKKAPEGVVFEDETDYKAALDSGEWFTSRQFEPDAESEKAKKKPAKTAKKGK